MIYVSQPAMPTDIETPTDLRGLSVRQYFAALAMQGLLSNPVIVTGDKKTISIDALSESATDYADALIARLNKDNNL